MIGEVEIVNQDGTHTYTLNTDGGTSPLKDFDVTIPDRSDTKRYKQQQSGAWPTRSYEGEMQIHIEGALFASTSAAYITERQNLLLACRGVPGAMISAYKRGTIFFTPEGATERWSADFGAFTFSGPVQGNYPAYTDILLTLESWTPWFIGETTDTNYYWFA